MIIPKKLNQAITRLNARGEEKLFMIKAAEEILEKIEETTVGNPVEVYEAARHLLGRGKLLRGILVMLINRVYNFHRKEKALKLATAIELLHTASLIHDDIIDEAKIRRGVETVHKRYHLNVAIVSTDLLISIAYNLCADLGEKAIKMVSEAGRRMSEAEVLECIVEDPNLNDYFKIVDGKSSALIEAACASSAIISKAREDEILAFKRYGELIGEVLQIRDDMLDYISSEEMTGKSNPLVHSLKRINIIDILKNEKKLTRDKALAEANELGKKLADKASDEVMFVELKKRGIFKEFVKFIFERTY